MVNVLCPGGWLVDRAGAKNRFLKKKFLGFLPRDAL